MRNRKRHGPRRFAASAINNHTIVPVHATAQTCCGRVGMSDAWRSVVWSAHLPHYLSRTPDYIRRSCQDSATNHQSAQQYNVQNHRLIIVHMQREKFTRNTLPGYTAAIPPRSSLPLTNTPLPAASCCTEDPVIAGQKLVQHGQHTVVADGTHPNRSRISVFSFSGFEVWEA